VNGFRLRVGIIIALGVVAAGVLALLPPLPQDPRYHDFADQRHLLGIPHALNVLSNLPFCIVGAMGLAQVFRAGGEQFQQPVERWPYAVLFAGVALTGIGSSYYHLDPNNQRLVWDRLPMTVAFMGFFAAMIAERINLRAGVGLLGPLVALGAASVFYWYEGELHGAGDLRPYFLVQFYPMAVTPLLLLLFPPRYTGTAYVWAALGSYLLAKVVELRALDHGFLELGGVVSGHTLKHLFAALGAYWLAQMLRTRRAVSPA
jgi:hypothetical protein